MTVHVDVVTSSSFTSHYIFDILFYLFTSVPPPTTKTGLYPDLLSMRNTQNSNK